MKTAAARKSLIEESIEKNFQIACTLSVSEETLRKVRKFLVVGRIDDLGEYRGKSVEIEGNAVW